MARRNAVVTLALASLISFGAPNGAMGFEITDASPKEAILIREGINKAQAFLGGCGLATFEPRQVVVETQPLVDDGLHRLATYNYVTKTIRISRFEILTIFANKDDVYALIPQSELYASLIAHETAHAIIFGNLNSQEIQHIAHEYIAYLVQFSTLSPHTLGKLTTTLSDSVWNTLDPFNETMLLMAPHLFGLQAYLNFRLDGNGCPLIHGILANRIRFPSDE